MIELPRDDKPVLFLMVGLPASGKTTIAAQLAEQLEIPVVAYEKLRHAAAGDQVPPGMGHKFLDWAADMAGWYLHQGQSVIYDAHNLNRAVREGLIAGARGLGAHVLAVWTICDRRSAVERLKQGGYDPHAYQAAKALFQSPSIAEGFYQVSLIDTNAVSLLLPDGTQDGEDA